MEVKKTEDGAPVFHVFIKASPEAWYYFGFEDNRLLIHSANSEFNGVIAKKSNAGKAKIGEVAFLPGSDDETLAFINRFRQQYYGIDVPYSLSDGSTSSKLAIIPLDWHSDTVWMQVSSCASITSPTHADSASARS